MDAYLGWVDENDVPHVADGFSNEDSSPVYDVEQNYLLINGSRTDYELSITFERSLNADDADDFDWVSTDGDVWAFWAVSPRPPRSSTGLGSGLAYHSRAGSFLFNLGISTATESPSPSSHLPSASPTPSSSPVPSPTPTPNSDGQLTTFQDPTGIFQCQWVMKASSEDSPSPDTIKFTMQAKGAGWVSLGFSAKAQGHDETDMVIAWISDEGEAVLVDAFSDSQSTPDLRPKISTISSATRTNDVLTVVFERPLIGPSFTFRKGYVSSIAWAHGTSVPTSLDTLPTHNRESRGVFQIEDIFSATGGVKPLAGKNSGGIDAGLVFTITIALIWAMMSMAKLGRLAAKRHWRLYGKALQLHRRKHHSWHTIFDADPC